MICFETHISDSIFEFFQKNQKSLLHFTKINSIIKEVSGINDFFTNQEQANELLETIKEHNSIVSEPDRREYGDFQTNQILAQKVVDYTFSKSNDFEFVLEPTCGKGNFLLAAIKQSKKLIKVVGVEIYQPYVWETKFKILEYFISVKENTKPEIDIIHANAFEFSYEELAKSTQDLKTLIIGNPPWVTNSELGSIDSRNLPQKSNFKKHSGFEAITGKGNFDIGEYISLIMLRCFDRHNGAFAFLIKNSVVKNLIYDQKQNKFRIGQTENLNIDSKKEFNVSVNACLFLTHLNCEPELTCTAFDFYTKDKLTTFGWYKDKFVYSVQDYDESSIVDGKSTFVWRSGVKHDCSKVMELEQVNGHFKNALGEEINLENNLTYGLLKSSDLKEDKTNSFRKLTIITQKKIGQETKYIKDKYPLTYNYLTSHKEYFDKRKSSIYKDKPSFSIFGIGDYSFAPYKIAISGLYKSTHFTLVSPSNSKPIMLDDTCYFIGFENLKMAEIAHYLVNSELVQKFLKSIIFSDSKRSINKDTLMRIDFARAFESTGYEQASKEIKGLEPEHWEKFSEMIKEEVTEQMTLF
ncbi:hypothetical protein [Aequorivita marisscotiae]|uniref:Uncharacterized protein n=1 Tax=Aequorivita marisscotiae TaxID=3040348 RepID=A0ABY8KXC0_9FLAO|nr:hypothetical protein [Aequorivita sp. Ant34-E75]WGF94024.1 hypothetical protein QCQ61_07480 [Aequorivita sp. Ant34-E75]